MSGLIAQAHHTRPDLRDGAERRVEIKWQIFHFMRAQFDINQTRLCPSENFGHERSSASKYRKCIDTVRHQPAGLDIIFEGKHGRQVVPHRKIGDMGTLKTECRA